MCNTHSGIAVANEVKKILSPSLPASPSTNAVSLIERRPKLKGKAKLASSKYGSQPPPEKRVLSALRLFPDLFHPLFTKSGKYCGSDMLKIVKFPGNLDAEEKGLADTFLAAIRKLTNKGVFCIQTICCVYVTTTQCSYNNVLSNYKLLV